MKVLERIELLVPVTVNGCNYEPGVCLVTANRAEQFIQDGVARAIRSGRTGSKSAKPLGEPWAESLRDGDIYRWQISLKLPTLSKSSSRTARRGSAGLREIGGDTARPTPTQIKAIRYLAKHEAALYPKLLKALAAYAKSFRSDWKKNDPAQADEVIPAHMTPKQTGERINFTHAAISRRSRDGVAYVELHGECAWDPYHGFVIVLHRSRVVDVLQQGSGWSDRRGR